MKKIIIIAWIICLGGIGISCTKFSELNTDPTKSSNMDPNMQLSYVELSTWGMADAAQGLEDYPSSFVQQFQGEYNITNWGGQYRKHDQDFSVIWDNFYAGAIKNIVDILEKTKDKAEYQNLRSICRIYKVYLFSILTDLYGDIPYSEAGRGFLDANFSPKYDAQKSIYTDFFKELSEAGAALGDNGSLPVTGDLIYKGDLSRWKKLAAALHLRYGLRIIKADPTKAKAEIQKAIQSNYGLFTSSADEALIPYIDQFSWTPTEIRRNGMSQVWIGREASPLCFLCATFWNYLKENNDPRLLVIGRAYFGDGNFTGTDVLKRTDITDEVIANGGVDKFQPPKPGFFWYDNWPSGYYSPTLKVWVDKWIRPQLNNIFLKGSIPGVIMTYSEQQLLLSEVAARWPDLGLPANAQTYFNQGVSAAMRFLSERYGAQVISDDEIQTYLNNHVFPQDLQGRLKAINEQLWVLHLTNPPEAYANWRRSGYPVLQPSNKYGAITIDAQTIPRRLPYPLFEKSYNKKGYEAAINALGGSDDWTKSVWWDKVQP